MNIIDRIFQSVSSFRSKQRLVIMLACSIVLVATLCCFFAYTLFSFSRDSRARLGALSDVIGADVGAALAFGDDQAVNKSLEAFRADPFIKQIFVLNEKDQVSAYYHYKLNVVPADLQQRLKNTRDDADELKFDLCPIVVRPVIMSGIHLGTVIIEQNEHVIYEKMAVSAAIGALILLLALWFSYLLANRFQRVVTDPVSHMATTMQEVSCTKSEYHPAVLMRWTSWRRVLMRCCLKLNDGMKTFWCVMISCTTWQIMMP